MYTFLNRFDWIQWDLSRHMHCKVIKYSPPVGLTDRNLWTMWFANHFPAILKIFWHNQRVQANLQQLGPSHQIHPLSTAFATFSKCYATTNSLWHVNFALGQLGAADSDSNLDTQASPFLKATHRARWQEINVSYFFSFYTLKCLWTI